MSLEKFLDEPWKNSHRAYDESSFNIRPAPEFSTGEVAVASLYRASGFMGYAENGVPKAGREFERASDKEKSDPKARLVVSGDIWRTVLHRVLESPKVPKQSSKRFLSLTPLVPDVALYSGSARLAGNSWNPGALVKRMVQLGAASHGDAERLWERLFIALSVGESDDIWARWLGEQFTARRRNGEEWLRTSFDPVDGIPDGEKSKLTFPAKQFVRDLDAIIDAKPHMTRRQWVSLLEALIRIGSVSHVLWLCRVNDRLWRVIASLLGHMDGKIPSSLAEMFDEILHGEARSLSYGNPAVPTIKDYASRYLLARLGINRVLWELEARGKGVDKLKSAEDLWAFMQLVRREAPELRSSRIIESFKELQDKESRTVACKKGVGTNLIEFSQYTLGQRQTSDESLRGYDQSYFLRKRGASRSAPWVLSPGPVAVLAVVHCCLHEVKGPRSVQRLSKHLSMYGIEFDVENVNDSDLGRQLRMLGLVLDSPDAESGMLLIPPFGTS